MFHLLQETFAFDDIEENYILFFSSCNEMQAN